jgi:glycosyltransferase involved in cell wall biosynthesis
MRIGIVSTHSWPVPNSRHTGDHFYAGLAKTFDEMGHEVFFFAPDGSYAPPHGKQLTMPCAYGKWSNEMTSAICEQQCYDMHSDLLKSLDIVHDFSVSKVVVENLHKEGYKNTISTPLGGVWKYPNPSRNFVVCSEDMKRRGLRGATDYEGTSTPDAAGSPQTPIKDAHVVYYGIDTDFYTPTYNKENFFLWFGRWHPVRGYEVAIDIAKRTGVELIMAGEHPDREDDTYLKNRCLDALKLAKGIPNIHFEWLPADPYHHEAKRDLIRRAKALLFPVQFQEPFGLMQPESLACGTPVIGTNLGSVPEVIEDSITGYVVDNSFAGFSEALKKIDNIIPAVCRSQAVKRFDRHVMAEAYIKEYQFVIDGMEW